MPFRHYKSLNKTPLGLDDEGDDLMADLRDTFALAVKDDNYQQQNKKHKKPVSGRMKRAATARIRRELIAAPEKPKTAGELLAAPPKQPKLPTNVAIARGKGLRRLSFVQLEKPERCKGVYPLADTPSNGRFTPTGGFYVEDRLDFEFHVKKTSDFGSAPSPSSAGLTSLHSTAAGGRPFSAPVMRKSFLQRYGRNAEAVRELEDLTATTLRTTSSFGLDRSAGGEPDEGGSEDDEQPRKTPQLSDQELARRRGLGLGGFGGSTGGNGYGDGDEPIEESDCRVTLWVPIPNHEDPQSYRHLLRSYQNRLPDGSKLVVVMNKLWYNEEIRDVTMVFPWAKAKKSKAFEMTMQSLCRTSVLMENAVRKGKWILCPARPDMERYFYDYCKGRLTVENPAKAMLAPVFTNHRSAFEDSLEQQEENAINDLLKVSSQESIRVKTPGGGDRSHSAASGKRSVSPFEAQAAMMSARQIALNTEPISSSDSDSEDSSTDSRGRKRINPNKRNSLAFFNVVVNLQKKAKSAKAAAEDWAPDHQLKTL